MSLPSFRRTVTVTPWRSRRFWKAATRRLGFRGLSSTSLRGIRFTCPRVPFRSRASWSAWASESFTPSIMAYS